jgi:hypothetical protein
MATGRVPTTANSPLTAKGDLFTYSTAPARLAVGNNGETLVADSSTSTGLRWQGDYAAGKNKIINGDFGIWQRGTSIALNFTTAYTADRWKLTSFSNSTTSRQAFTPGTAPVAGYEGNYYLRFTRASAGASQDEMRQEIEDVTTFANQSVTVSFWAKVASGTPQISTFFVQNFGSGGSTEVQTSATNLTLNTSWARYTVSLTIPSISGKTIGSSSYLGLRFGIPTALGGITLDLWGVQVEAGSVATAFQTATGTLQGELAACQRYYYRAVADTAYGTVASYAVASSSSGFISMIQAPVTMRVSPTSIDFSTLAFVNYADTLYAASSLTLPANNNKQNIFVSGSMTGATAGHAGRLTGNNSTSAFLGFSAEL